jgi:hypothetical protein
MQVLLLILLRDEMVAFHIMEIAGILCSLFPIIIHRTIRNQPRGAGYTPGGF